MPCSRRQLVPCFFDDLQRAWATLCSPNQACATPPPFWQTRLFTNSSNISTTICGSQFLGIREKAGLSKWGRSGTCLNVTPCGEHKLRDFKTPYLKEFKLACVSTQIWGMLHISFKSFQFDMRNSKTIYRKCATFPRFEYSRMPTRTP